MTSSTVINLTIPNCIFLISSYALIHYSFNLIFFTHSFVRILLNKQNDHEPYYALNRSSESQYSTIDELIAAKNVVFREKVPSRKPTENELRDSRFLYKRVECSRLERIAGEFAEFDICLPRALVKEDDDQHISAAMSTNDRVAYFINGQRRDKRLEQSFLEATLFSYMTRVFTAAPVTEEESETVVIAKAARITTFSLGKSSEETEPLIPTIGIKELLDGYDDAKRTEFIRVDLDNETSSALISISEVVPACNYLATMDRDFEAIRYLILRLAYTTLFPYAIVEDQHNRVHISFLNRYCMEKYGVDDAQLIDSVYAKSTV